MSVTTIFWDIDGTLLSTGRAGVFALEEATATVYGRELDLQALPTGGLTDAEIALEIGRVGGLDPDAKTVAAFLRVYEDALPDALPRRTGTVLPGVVAALEDLAGRDDVLCLLLTGNTPRGAAAKLAHYGLDGLVREGAFCVPPYRGREAIARTASQLARERLGAPSAPERTFVIGDTPHDIRCARAAGARAVAVATGAYSQDDLKRHEPWLLLPAIPEPTALRTALHIT